MLNLSDLVTLLYCNYDCSDISVIVRVGRSVIANSRVLSKNERPFEQPIELYSYKALKGRKFMKVHQDSLGVEFVAIEL